MSASVWTDDPWDQFRFYENAAIDGADRICRPIFTAETMVSMSSGAER